MIAIDTNVLVRVLVQDNAAEAKSAVTFLRKRSKDDPAFVSAVVLAELAWVLRRPYGYSAEQVHSAFNWIFESENLLIEHEESLDLAIAQARTANADIADAIIAAIAAQAGAGKTVTFDRLAASRISGMELLT